MTAPRLVAIVSLTIGLLAASLAAEAQVTRVYRVALVLTTSPVAEMAGPEPIHPLVTAVLLNVGPERRRDADELGDDLLRRAGV